MILTAQEFSFAKDFKSGKLILNDKSELNGELKWFPSQNSDVKFRKTNEDKIIKYGPNEISGFRVENINFVSLKDFTVFADNYALIGQTTKIKEAFVQVISEGKFNIYLASITGYDPIGRNIQNYDNFIFQNSENNKIYAYPYLIRMKEKKYEKAKEDLYVLFKDYPQIIEKIKNYQKEDNFLEIIDLVTNLK